MPFASEKQRRYLWKFHPDVAKRWAAEYPLSGLVKHAGKGTKRRRRGSPR